MNPLNSKYALNLTLFFSDEEKTSKVFNSILPELNTVPEHRSRTTISIKNNCIVIKISSMDVTALKASINLHLKGIILSHNLLEKIC